ncbi:MAG: DUF1667 domain-containing protein [Oscillospiraceae bacterium]|nr:DUF1667 domain-containing protein [Oscillospiraceae bacterium]
MKKEITCIVCPKGCLVTIDDANLEDVSGFGCPKGIEYAKNELLHPVRTVTSTVKIEGALHDRLPVRTNGDILKELIFECMKLIRATKVSAPVRCGQVIIEDILGTGIDLIATRNA